METIVIQQIDDTGQVYRTFRHYPRDLSDLDRKLHNISRAYNLDRTRVFVGSCQVH